MAVQPARDVARRRQLSTSLALMPPPWSTLSSEPNTTRRPPPVTEHTVVGPGGIFVIHAVWASRGWIDHYGRMDECRRHARAVAARAGEYADTVVPVLCSSDRDARTGWSEDILFATPETLAGLLTTRPLMMGTRHVVEATALLQRGVTPGRARRRRHNPTHSWGPGLGPGGRSVTRLGVLVTLLLLSILVVAPTVVATAASRIGG